VRTEPQDAFDSGRDAPLISSRGCLRPSCARPLGGPRISSAARSAWHRLSFLLSCLRRVPQLHAPPRCWCLVCLLLARARGTSHWGLGAGGWGHPLGESNALALVPPPLSPALALTHYPTQNPSCCFLPLICYLPATSRVLPATSGQWAPSGGGGGEAETEAHHPPVAAPLPLWPVCSLASGDV
jgi:hypothetical protein